MLVSDPISPGGEINWGPIDVWPVRLKDGEKVLDLFYVGNGWVFDKPQASPEKSGYTFSHWENSEGKKAFVGGFLAGQEQINGATDFYASWIQDQDKGWTFDQNRKLTSGHGRLGIVFREGSRSGNERGNQKRRKQYKRRRA